MNTVSRIVCVASLLAAGSVAMAQSFSESGAAGTFSTSNWSEDRYAPGGWASGATDPLGGPALRIDIANADRADGSARAGRSDAFYNTQGRVRQANIGQGWTVSGELFIPASWGDSGNLRRSDLWTRDQNTDENAAAYPIVGFINNDPSDPFNPSGSAFQPRFRFWNSTIGWQDLPSVSVNYGAYNSFQIVDTGSAYQYFINGTNVGAFNAGGYSASGAEGLRSVFVQAYNFGNADNSGSLTDSSYSAYWRNVSAVPTPGAAAALGLAGLVGLRRRR